MFLPAPALDDTRWRELVEESRALIPLYAPEWTDHNYSDPGITFAELFAWLAEMQIFQLDQVPERHRRKFLALVGIEPAPPAAARTVVRFGVDDGGQPLDLPATIECKGVDPSGTAVRVRTLRPVRVLPVHLRTASAVTAAGAQALEARLGRGEPWTPFGDDPRPGTALVLGLDAALAPGAPATIAVTCASDRADQTERERLGDAAATHHSARVVWELRVGPDRWRALDPQAGEVVDDTRALTLDGCVDIVAPEAMQPDDDGRFLVRCRFARGAFDEAPSLRDIAVNAVPAEQAVPAVGRWRIAADATVVGTPAPGAVAHLGVAVGRDEHGVVVTALDVTEADAPVVLVLAYRAPAAGQPGELVAEAVLAARGSGRPETVVTLDPEPVQAASLRLWSGEGSSWRRWSIRRDLDASGPADAHAVLDPATGTVRFGDGRHGLAPPEGDLIVAAYRSTLGPGGNLAAGAIQSVADDDHNRALLPAAPAVEVTNTIACSGGAAAETLESAEGRAAELAGQVTRAVTAGDYERLAVATPGVRLARASARANLHPAFPCVRATGVVTVIVVPHLPRDRPAPSAGLLRAVAAYLDARRIIGTRVEVTGPAYTELRVRARVRAMPLTETAQVRDAILAALAAFFDPLRGGSDGTGWPFGRDVIRSEVLQEIDDAPGVDHVLALDLLGPDGASCGNLCVGPLSLVAAADHEIEVVRG